jgi:hypothetical protein
MFAPAILDLDGKRSPVRLTYPHDSHLGGVPQQAEVCSIRTEHIHQIGRQPPEDIDREIEAVRCRDANGVTVLGRSVFEPCLDRAVLRHVLTMPA